MSSFLSCTLSVDKQEKLRVDILSVRGESRRVGGGVLWTSILIDRFFGKCAFLFFYLRTLRKTKDYRCLAVTADAIIQHKGTTASYFFNFLLTSAYILKEIKVLNPDLKLL